MHYCQMFGRDQAELAYSISSNKFREKCTIAQTTKNVWFPKDLDGLDG